VQIVNWSIQTPQQVEALLGHTSLDHATVIGLALAGDETGFFEAVEQAGHVRIVGNHALANIAASQSARFGATKNAQDVVLNAGHTKLLEELFGLLSQGVRGTLYGNEGMVFQGQDRRRVWGARRHSGIIVVITIIGKRKDFEDSA
jgi:hypothetical protein